MHVADPRLGIFGANGIVGAGLPIAVGAAFAAKDRGEGDLVVAFFGDGAIATGAFHEAMNMAALWKLPIIFLCENNGFSEFSSTVDQHPVPISARAAGYGMKSITLAGNDVEAVADGIRPVYEQVRGSGGPVFVEVTTLRVHGHYEGDPQVYRDKDEMARDILAADPLTLTRGRLRELGIGDEVLDLVDKRVRAVVAEAGAFRAVVAATGGVERDGVHLFAAVASYPPDRLDVGVGAGGAAVSQSKILKAALDDSLAADPDVFLAGIDVAGGNVFGLTRGLAAKYPGRVLDTPISESAIMGLAVGSAMAGRRPVVELMYPRLPRGVPGSVDESGGKTSVHDGRRSESAVGGADAVRFRQIVGWSAFAESRGAVGAHPGTDCAHAEFGRGCIRVVAGSDRGRQPGHVHRASTAVREEKFVAEQGFSGSDRKGSGDETRFGRHHRLVVAYGHCTPWSRRRRWQTKGSMPRSSIYERLLRSIGRRFSNHSVGRTGWSLPRKPSWTSASEPRSQLWRWIPGSIHWTRR